MCFALFLFVTCFGWNFNAIAATAAAVVVVAAAVAAAAGGGGLSGCNYDEHRNLPYFPYHFTIQLTFLPYFPYLFTIQLTFPPYFPGEALRGDACSDIAQILVAHALAPPFQWNPVKRPQ